MSDRTITYLGETYSCRSGESVLNALLRQGVPVSFSCRKGSCTVCMQRCVDGEIPAEARRRINANLAARGYFLPCMCHPSGDLVIEPPRPDDLFCRARVAAKKALTPDICRLSLEPVLNIEYSAGQFIQLRRADGLTRSYSLASVYGEDYYLELHIKRVANGSMSRWIHDELAVDDELEIQGPNGTNFYRPANPDQLIVLIGTGTGLAPLYGIARDAIAQHHRGEIHLYHGARTPESLYLGRELLALSERTDNFHYHPLVSGNADTTPWNNAPFLPDTVLDAFAALGDARIHLAGAPAMIDRAQALLAERNVGPDGVFADAFVTAGPVVEAVPGSRTAASERKKSGRIDLLQKEIGPRSFPPDPEMWSALEEGRLLDRILTEFYGIAFEDERLGPYFQDVTQSRLIEKVYSFLRQIFTGERLYFGNRPRNAHHWMVIDDYLFDYREGLMKDCMRRHGLAEHLIKRWCAIEELFRRDIVKDKPWKRIVGNAEIPVDGFGKDILSDATLCDSCGREVDAGEQVSYHLRLGTVYCAACSNRASAEPAVANSL